MGAENHASTEIRSPDRPARNELLCRLCYPGQLRNVLVLFFALQSVDTVSPLVGCPQLHVHYIHSCSPYLETVQKRKVTQFCYASCFCELFDSFTVGD
jgi:hypothetical protein